MSARPVISARGRLVDPDRYYGPPVHLVPPPCPAGFAAIDHYLDKNHNSIRWCARTWNLFIGCTKVSEGCRSCYAVDEGVHQIMMHPETSQYRLVVLPGDQPNWTGIVQPTGVKRWTAPFRTRKHWLAFANSMSDPFHDRISDQQILFFIQVLAYARWHTWQVLTKRAARMASIMSRLILKDGVLNLSPSPVPFEQRFMIPNAWFGVTTENQRRADERIPLLMQVRAAVRFVSAEPLLDGLDLRPYTPWIDWLIVGGESGKQFRPMQDAWALDLRNQCASTGTAYFFKQRSGGSPQYLPKTLDGELWRQFPERAVLDVPSDAERRALKTWVAEEYGRIFLEE